MTSLQTMQSQGQQPPKNGEKPGMDFLSTSEKTNPATTIWDILPPQLEK